MTQHVLPRSAKHAPHVLVRELMPALTSLLTRSVAHAVVPALVHTLTHSPLQDYYCYYWCAPRACALARAATHSLARRARQLQTQGVLRVLSLLYAPRPADGALFAAPNRTFPRLAAAPLQLYYATYYAGYYSQYYSVYYSDKFAERLQHSPLFP